MGWAIGDPALIGYITKAHQYISTCANWLAQKVTAYALSQERAYLREDVCQQLKRSYQYTADFLQTNLPAIPILQPNSTPYLLLRLGSDDVDFCYYAAQKGVIIVPGTAFGEISKGWVRINFALEAELLQSGLLRLEHALASGTQITNL
jgi:aminotransferase